MRSLFEQCDVRFGSKADICGAKRHVRFTPNSDRESGSSSCEQKRQTLIGPVRFDLQHFRADDAMFDERIALHSLLEIRHCRVMRDDCSSRIWQQAANEQEYAFVDTPLYPSVMRLHELASLALVAGKSKKHNEHHKLQRLRQGMVSTLACA